MFGSGILPPVVAHLVADITGFSAGMGAAASEVRALEARGTSSMRALGAIGKAAFMGLAVGAIAVGAASVHMASNFDATMERVHTQAGASQREVDGLKDGVLRLGYATGQGPTKLADALFHVESVGYRGAAAMSVLTDAAKLATISGANLDDTTYGLTSVMQTFGAKAQDSAKWAAFFNSVVGAGDMRMEAFNKAVGTGYFSAAQTFGVSAQSAGAALAFMTDRGAHADEAATRLRMTLALMAAPSAKAATLLRDIGLKGGDVKAATSSMTEALAKAHLTTVSLAADLKKPDGLYEALHHLQTALKASGLSAEAANALLSHSFGGGKSDATILAMLNNLDTLKSKYAAVGKGMGSYAESFKAASDQFQTKMHRLEAGAEALGIKFGNYLIPKIEQVVGWIMQAADWCSKNQTTVQYLAAAIGGVLAVAIGAWIILMIQAAAANIAATWEILVIIAAVALLAAGILYLVKHWSQVWGAIVGVTKAVAKDIGAVWDTIVKWTVDKFNAIANWFKKWWPLLLVIFAFPLAVIVGLWNHFHSAVWSAIVTAWNGIKFYFSYTFGALASLVWGWVTTMYKYVNQFANWLNSGISSLFIGIYNWLNGFANSFNNVGWAIIKGIWSGIAAGWNWLTGQVSNLAGSLLSAATSALGINSPSKVFADVVGRAIPEGIGKGINDHAHLAHAAVSRLAGGLASPGGASHMAVTGAGVSGGGSGTLILNLTTEAKVDAGVLFKTTQSTALRYQKQNGRQAFALPAAS